MKSKTKKHGLKRITALLLTAVLCVGMVYPAPLLRRKTVITILQSIGRRRTTAPMNWMLMLQSPMKLFNAGSVSSRPLSLPSAPRNTPVTVRQP